MPDSSTDCSAFRLEWRPSRCGIAAALLLPTALGLGLALSGLPTLAAVFSVALPERLSLLLALAGGLVGLWRACRAARCPPRVFELLEGRRIVPEGGIIARPASFTERWPLAVLRIEPEGPAWVFWPDTLSSPARRRCRLWASAAPAALVLHHWML